MKTKKLIINIITSKLFCFVIIFVLPFMKYVKLSSGIIPKSQEDLFNFIVLIIIIPMFFELCWKFILKRQIDDVKEYFK
jgi:Na+/phosphate symporter